MKTLKLDDISAGVRRLGNVKALHLFMEQAYTETFTSLIYGLLNSSNSATILYGCVNSGSGSNYNISAGAIWYQGEVFNVPSFVGTAPGGQVPVASISQVYTQLRYTDNTLRDTLNVRTITWAFGTSGSGVCDFSALQTMKTQINTLIDVPGQIAALVNSAPATLDTLKELADALGDDANFATTMTTQLGLKANKAQAAWSNISFGSSGWSTWVSPTDAKKRIDEFGKAHFRGRIKASAGNETATAAGAVPSAPTNSRIEIIKPYTANGGGSYLGECMIVIEDDGTLYISKIGGWSNPSAIDAAVSLEGISYWPQGS
jgi:hypothetical protein